MKKDTCEHCDEPVASKGMCRGHYEQITRGDGKIRPINKYDGRSSHPLYRTYKDMLRRCNNEKRSDYAYYGGRGIEVCDRWLGVAGEGFWNFVEDMGDRPSSKHSIDRIDNDKNYTPDNCRWATQRQQRINSRPRMSSSGIVGVVPRNDSDKWMAHISINKKLKWLGTFDTKQDAARARAAAEEKYYADV